MPKKTLEKTDTSARGNIDPRTPAWCFTSYDLTEPVFLEEMRYLCYSPENCPTSGRFHWQGYFYLKNKCVMKSACKIFKDYNISVTAADGSPQQNRRYCGGEHYEKDGKIKEPNPDFKEFGEIPQKGKRNDLTEIAEQIQSGAVTVEDIIVTKPILYHQYGRTLNAIEDITLQKKWRTEMTEGIWIVGATGRGKSHEAFKDYNPDTHYVHIITDKGWWDNYKQQDTVIINDFRGQIQYDDLLQLIDKWPYSVPRRGRPPIPFISKKIIITSPMMPEEVYHNRCEKDDIKQLMRRLTIIKMDKMWKDN